MGNSTIPTRLTVCCLFARNISEGKLPEWAIYCSKGFDEGLSKCEAPFRPACYTAKRRHSLSPQTDLDKFLVTLHNICIWLPNSFLRIWRLRSSSKQWKLPGGTVRKSNLLMLSITDKRVLSMNHSNPFYPDVPIQSHCPERRSGYQIGRY